MRFLVLSIRLPTKSRWATTPNFVIPPVPACRGTEAQRRGGICSFTFVHKRICRGPSRLPVPFLHQAKLQVPYATPNSLSRLVALANFLRLSLRKAAYVALGGIVMQEIGSASVPRQAGTGGMTN